jgi:hypothetical protein
LWRKGRTMSGKARNRREMRMRGLYLHNNANALVFTRQGECKTLVVRQVDSQYLEYQLYLLRTDFAFSTWVAVLRSSNPWCPSLS